MTRSRSIVWVWGILLVLHLVSLGTGTFPSLLRWSAILSILPATIFVFYSAIRPSIRNIILIVSLAVVAGIPISRPLILYSDSDASLLLTAVLLFDWIAVLAFVSMIAFLSPATSFVLSYLLAFSLLGYLAIYIMGSTQLPLHFEIGGLKAIPSTAGSDPYYTFFPFSRCRGYYPDNPRKYFQTADQTSNHQWQSWGLSFPNEVATTAQVHYAGASGSIAICKLSGDDQKDPWRATWGRRSLNLPTNSSCAVQFAARATSPFKAHFRAFDGNREETYCDKTFDITDKWLINRFEFSSKTSTTDAGLSIMIGATESAVEFDLLSITVNGMQIGEAPDVTPYFIEYSHNSVGFRDNEYVIPKPRDVFRIVCLGDSFTWGQGVHVQDTYSKVLERNLNSSKQFQGKRFEVINAGRFGYGTLEERLSFEYEASKYEPQLVILQMLDNDDESNSNIEPFSVSNQGFGYERCADEIRLLHSACEQRNCRLIIFLFRLEPFRRSWRLLKGAVMTRTADLKIPILDFGTFIENKYSQWWLLRPNFTVHYRDGHPNEKAHHLAAQAIEEFLAKNGLF